MFDYNELKGFKYIIEDFFNNPVIINQPASYTSNTINSLLFSLIINTL